MTRSRPVGHLLRVLGLAFGLAVVVGGTVGQGIFRTPGLVAASITEPALILTLWAVGGLLVAIDACAMVELSASVREAGGPYVYVRRAFGRVAGSVAGWADFLLWIMVLAFLAVVFGEYVHQIGLAAAVPSWALSTALIAACWAINWTGSRASGASQTLFSAIKGVVLIGLIAALFAKGAAPSVVAPATAVPAIGLIALAGAMRAVINTYSGWWSSTYFNEELKRPRDLVRSTFGGIALVTILYVLVNAALLHGLSPAEMAASKLPAADAATRALGTTGGTVITAIAIFSVVAITNLIMMLASRIGYGMARDGVLPVVLGQVSAGGTPRASLTVAALAAAIAALSGSYEALIAVTVPLTIAILGAVDLAAIIVRRREPDLERPFKMPLFPLPAVIGLLINAALLAAMLYDDPFHAGIGIGSAVVLGIGYALIGRRGMPLAPTL